VRVIIQQRVHEQDIVGEVLRQGAYHHLDLPMGYEPTVMVSGSSLLHDRHTEEGELLWPERFGEAEVRELKRELGPCAWAGQYQRSPTPRAGAVVDPNAFRPLPDGWKREDLPTVEFWDLAYGEKTMPDHTAAVTIVLDGDDLIVVYVYRERSPRRAWPGPSPSTSWLLSQTWSASRRPPSSRPQRCSWCSGCDAWPEHGPPLGQDGRFYWRF
jgi:hypothetical protein